MDSQQKSGGLNRPVCATFLLNSTRHKCIIEQIVYESKPMKERAL
jgi:hypothetical protein